MAKQSAVRQQSPVALVRGGATMAPAEQAAAISAAVDTARRVRVIVPTERSSAGAPLGATEREFGENIWAKMVDGNLVLTIPVRDIQAVTPLDANGHRVLARTSGFGTVQIGGNLGFSFYLQEGTRPKKGK
jgi:hypothetical protein